MTEPLSRLAGWCWADGTLTRDAGSLTTRRWGPIHEAFLAAARAAGRPVTTTRVGLLRIRLHVPGPFPLLPEVPDPLAALASIIECEGTRNGKILDDPHDDRLDQAVWLLDRALPPGSWRRVRWRTGGGALWVASPAALDVLAAAPFVTRSRVPTRLPEV